MGSRRSPGGSEAPCSSVRPLLSNHPGQTGRWLKRSLLRTAYDRPTPEESPAIRSQIADRSCRFDTIVTPPTASAFPRAGAVSFGGSCAHPFSADYKTDFICHGWLSHESGPYVSSPRLARDVRVTLEKVPSRYLIVPCAPRGS